MDRLEIKAYAKINWALRITGRREDGYHLLDMLMQQISLHDDLTFAKACETVLYVNGARDAEAEKNLIVKAVRALEKRTGRNLPVSIALEKRIPSRAGLGGGSSDCAAALRAVNTLYSLGLTDGELAETGLTLGADVPFFIYGGFCRVQGIGEKICPVLRAPDYHLVIRQAGNGLSTPEVYRESDKAGTFDEKLPDTAAGDIADGIFTEAVNALEAPAFALEPETGKLLEEMRLLPGALHARMSGSGSAVYAVFADEDKARSAALMSDDAIYARTLNKIS